MQSQPVQHRQPRRPQRPAEQEPFTTVMIRRLPVEMTEDQLISMLNSLVPGKFDFVYMPHDRRKKLNISLAFINFVDTGSAQEVADYVNRLNKRRQWTMVACASNVQSLHHNMAYYLARFGVHTIHDAYSPKLFQDGRLVENAGELVDIYKALPGNLFQEAKEFVKAEKAGQNVRGSQRRCIELVWKPGTSWKSTQLAAPGLEHRSTDVPISDFRLPPGLSSPSGGAKKSVSHVDSERSTSPSTCSDPVTAARCPQGADLQEGVLDLLLEQHGALIFSF